MTILAAGNGDVRDCLHALRENGSVAWNGINTVLRSRNADRTARVIHRTVTRSDAVLGSDGAVPLSLHNKEWPPDPFSIESQFCSDLFNVAADVVILSIQPDVMNALCWHREDGHYLYPYELARWPEEARQWLMANYQPIPMLRPDESMHNLERIITRIREKQQPHILVFNMCATMPWERVRTYRGLEETLSERIHRFNLSLIDLSRSTGIAIVDVDAILASAGAHSLKVDPVTLSAEACHLVTEEVVNILDEIGALSIEPAS